MSPITVLRHVLLALLAKEDQPAHGYGLMKSYQERMSVRLSIGNVYRELQRLAADGLITTAANPPGTDIRRTVYRLTEHGREALYVWLGTPVEGPGRSAAEEVGCRLAVLGDLDDEKASEVLSTLRQELWALAKTVEHERATAPPADNWHGPVSAIRETLLRRRAMLLAADIELVTDLISSLERRLASAGGTEAVGRGRARRSRGLESPPQPSAGRRTGRRMPRDGGDER